MFRSLDLLSCYKFKLGIVNHYSLSNNQVKNWGVNSKKGVIERDSPFLLAFLLLLVHPHICS